MTRLFFFLCLFSTTRLLAQNYVVNGSFERGKPNPACIFSSNPDVFNESVEKWHTFNMVTPDLFSFDSACSAHLPRPRTGTRMTGLIMYHPGTDSDHEYDYHEYVEGRFARALTPGKRYEASVWVHEGREAGAEHIRQLFGAKSRGVLCGNFGFFFSTTPSAPGENIRNSIFTYDMKPQAVCRDIVYAPDGWTKITLAFTASEAYKYFIFGNFASDGVTPTDLQETDNSRIEAHNVGAAAQNQKIKRIAYYFFDDFAVVEAPEKPGMAQQLLSGEKVTFEARLLFDTDQYQLKPEASGELEKLYQALQQQPEIRLEISGHTDNVGPSAHNLTLSERRADAVRQYLSGKGIAPERLRIKGWGDARPVAGNHTPEGRAANRRAECRKLHTD